MLVTGAIKRTPRDRAEIALALRMMTGGVTDRSTTVVGSVPQSPPSRIASISCRGALWISRPG